MYVVICTNKFQSNDKSNIVTQSRCN